ncbi:MAG: PAS domain-containing methyl-accepting chemotaxis protein [Gallionella sp.]|nr:PAS domain-containing methyl-accepting chemotaxis protein [Gallionella sp.]
MQNKNAYVSQKEVPFPPNTVLISRTDTKGIITYVNDTFVEMSGYTREELIGKSHNIVRHPDMPPQAFKWLWDTLKERRPWRGTVKNRCKNGDHYWVRATVAPVFEGGEVIGYSSVRRPPTREHIAEAETLYRRVNQSGEQLVSRFERFKFDNWTLSRKLQFAIQITLLAALGYGQYSVFQHMKEDARAVAVSDAKKLSNEIIDSSNMLMVAGQIGNPDLRQLLMKKIAASDGVRSVQLVRAKPVVDLYGPGLPEEQIANDVQRRAIETKQQIVTFNEDGTHVHVVTPYLASKDFHGTDCTGCHQVEEGAVLGVSELEIDVTPQFDAISKLEQRTLVGQIVLQVFLFFYLAFLVKKYVANPADVAQRDFEKLMQGDMNEEIDISGRDELGVLLCGVQTMQSYLRTIVDEVVTPVGKMQKRISDMGARVSSVADNAANEHQHIQQIVGTMEGFSRSVAGVANMAGDSLGDARAMQQVVEENSRNMELSIAATSKVADTVRGTSRTISDLGSAVDNIGSIANAIKEIAEQTNLLALNAAIEAARAGEQGRGFAVVADEVRKLAERTASSTKDIARTIGEISTISDAAVASMQDAVSEVETGISLIRKNGEGLKEIMQATNSVSQRIEHIAGASREQSEAGVSVSASLESISSLVDSNVQAAIEAKAEAEELSKAAVELRKAGYPLTKCAIG